MKTGDRVQVLSGYNILFDGDGEWGTVLEYKKGWLRYYWIVALDSGDIVKI